ncbi:MAG: hypothetical protein U5L03_15190 [Burkholderiaceae bacterium]|nr:hypothetical protein [Burkholderiaceae bacterium]
MLDQEHRGCGDALHQIASARQVSRSLSAGRQQPRLVIDVSSSVVDKPETSSPTKISLTTSRTFSCCAGEIRDFGPLFGASALRFALVRTARARSALFRRCPRQAPCSSKRAPMPRLTRLSTLPGPQPAPG